VKRALVTGGSGYFGSLLVHQLLRRGMTVRVLDLNDADDREPAVEFVAGDIRDAATVRDAVAGVDVVFHNVAQVPLARDRHLFESVNVGGMAVLLDASEDLGVGKLVVTSSSAVFGVPRENPVTETTPGRPAEAYGRAKLAAEHLCRAAVTRGMDVTVIRPRTILGHGRLGIFGILFDWIADGVDVFVLGDGSNRYQFIHAEDLADACIRAAARQGPAVYNIGAQEFGTMRETLEALCDHARTGAKVRSIPMRPAAAAMRVTAGLRLTPFAPYHWIMYGRSLYFDTTKAATELGWSAKWSNAEMLIQSYEWFLAHREHVGVAPGSAHRTPVKQGLLSVSKALLRLRS
jgi:nucleoside-diphosphate-sugar epimerase